VDGDGGSIRISSGSFSAVDHNPDNRFPSMEKFHGGLATYLDAIQPSAKPLKTSR
jgi:hypothetical protein